MKRTLLSVAMLCSAIVSFESQALFCANCANVVQMAQSNLSQAQGYVEEVQQTLNSIKNVQYQVQNLKNLKHMQWGDIQSQLRNLNTIASRGEAISFAMANMNQQFEQLFGGTDAYQGQSIADMNSVDAYRAQGNALRDTAQSSLALAQKMSQYQADDHQTVASIQSHAQGASGAMEIAQANAELLAQVAQQLQKLQTLLQTQIQMSATQIAANADTTERQRVAEEKMLTQPLNVDPTDGKDWSQEWQRPNMKW
ncbi:P-type conjugative transfer protein TrbJ [Vibrio harveyi]|uniref:P-type conjugative transfer protein TrbJ n=1 Tax=Vibrio harveyi TaxID=669 RepID=UPI001B83945B|nr:P-type conjugative transfer protein TrbJ [Vibrio parahaemolyticus]